jgi:hypothetical protein
MALSTQALIEGMMTPCELATSRVGYVADAENALQDIASLASALRAGETLRIPRAGAAGGSKRQVCELVLCQASDDGGVDAILAAVSTLTRDGVMVALVEAGDALVAAETAFTAGVDWVCVLDGDDPARRHLVATCGIHPTELGADFEAATVCGPRSTCVFVPHNRDDREHRRRIRRSGRARLLDLAAGIEAEHGSAVTRVVRGLEMLIADRPTELNDPAARPGVFVVPGLPSAPWPDMSAPSLARLVATVERAAPMVRAELGALTATPGSLKRYVKPGRMTTKFALRDRDDWQSLKLFADDRIASALPTDCKATRTLLQTVAGSVSNEAVVSRLAPGAALPQHYGGADYKLVMHLGLAIPADCGIRVGGIARCWEEERILAFSDVYLHEAWNYSTEPRDCVLIDVWHPDLSPSEIAALRLVHRELEALKQKGTPLA